MLGLEDKADYARLQNKVDRVMSYSQWPVNFNIAVKSFEPHIHSMQHLVDFSARARPASETSMEGTHQAPLQVFIPVTTWLLNTINEVATCIPSINNHHLRPDSFEMGKLEIKDNSRGCDPP